MTKNITGYKIFDQLSQFLLLLSYIDFIHAFRYCLQ